MEVCDEALGVTPGRTVLPQKRHTTSFPSASAFSIAPLKTSLPYNTFTSYLTPGLAASSTPLFCPGYRKKTVQKGVEMCGLKNRGCKLSMDALEV